LLNNGLGEGGQSAKNGHLVDTGGCGEKKKAEEMIDKMWNRRQGEKSENKGNHKKAGVEKIWGGQNSRDQESISPQNLLRGG